MIDFHTHILPNKVDNIIKRFGNDEVFKEMFGGSKETSDFSKLLKNMSIKDVVLKINHENNISKKIIYDFCLNKKNEI